MNGIEIANHRLKLRTRTRLLVSRLFGFAILVLLGLGSGYWSRAPLFEEMIFFTGVLLAILGFCGRLWCHSYIAGRKKRILVVAGPYSLCRHPLYFFSLVGGIGLCLCTETLMAPVLFAAAFAAYYPHIIRGEEMFLSENFPEYESYKRRIPLFFPRWSSFAESDILVNGSLFRRELIASGGFLSLIGVFEVIEILHHLNYLPTYFLIP
ncbi:MAG TPA: methyltransferase [Thermoanaerobaculia bacterium]|nr:methyltransferase [Thermoanaerobaculia bacterium]